MPTESLTLSKKIPVPSNEQTIERGKKFLVGCVVHNKLGSDGFHFLYIAKSLVRVEKDAAWPQRFGLQWCIPGLLCKRYHIWKFDIQKRNNSRLCDRCPNFQDHEGQQMPLLQKLCTVGINSISTLLGQDSLLTKTACYIMLLTCDPWRPQH